MVIGLLLPKAVLVAKYPGSLNVLPRDICMHTNTAAVPGIGTMKL